MHRSGETVDTAPSWLSGRGRAVALVALVLGLVLSSVLAFEAMRTPTTAASSGHVSGPR